jgi:hypothetical protein
MQLHNGPKKDVPMKNSPVIQSCDVTLQRKSHLCIPFQNFYIHLYVSVYIPRIGPHIFWSRIGRLIVGILYINR